MFGMKVTVNTKHNKTMIKKLEKYMVIIVKIIKISYVQLYSMSM